MICREKLLRKPCFLRAPQCQSCNLRHAVFDFNLAAHKRKISTQNQSVKREFSLMRVRKAKKHSLFVCLFVRVASAERRRFNRRPKNGRHWAELSRVLGNSALAACSSEEDAIRQSATLAESLLRVRVICRLQAEQGIRRATLTNKSLFEAAKLDKLRALPARASKLLRSDKSSSAALFPNLIFSSCCK